MFLLFDEPVAECWNDVEVEVVIDDVQSSEFCVKTLADWVNPYTYTFSAPGRTIIAVVSTIYAINCSANCLVAFLWWNYEECMIWVHQEVVLVR